MHYMKLTKRKRMPTQCVLNLFGDVRQFTDKNQAVFVLVSHCSS